MHDIQIKTLEFLLFIQIHEFSVEMTCSGCSGAVEKVLGKLGGKLIKHLNNGSSLIDCECSYVDCYLIYALKNR